MHLDEKIKHLEGEMKTHKADSDRKIQVIEAKISSNKDDKVLEDIKLNLEKNTETTGILGQCIKSIEAMLGEESKQRNEVEVKEINTRIKALEEDRPTRINDSIAEIQERERRRKNLIFFNIEESKSEDVET